MVTLDDILGWAEVLLVPLSLGWLLLALWRPKRGRLRAAAILTLALALTIAQPFGVVAHSQQGPPPATAELVDPQDIHVVSLGGIPVAPFKLYSREITLARLTEDGPAETLRARSWFWAPILSNSAKVADICGGLFNPPCWEPDKPYLDKSYLRPGSPNKYADTLTLARDGDQYWATFHNPSNRIYQIGTVPESFTYKLGFGIASYLGLAYWLVAGALVFLARRRGRSDGLLEPSMGARS